MDKGYWKRWSGIKDDAEPIDNITKFAWYPEDYEDKEEWVEYSDEEWTARRIDELQSSLNQTDYYAGKILETFLDCDGIVAILKWMKDSKATYGNMISQRIAWRQELKELLQSSNE